MPNGGLELVLILAIVLIIFGAGKLPQVFSSLGKGVREFREASEGRDETPPATTTTSATTTETPSAPTVPTATGSTTTTTSATTHEQNR